MRAKSSSCSSRMAALSLAIDWWLWLRSTSRLVLLYPLGHLWASAPRRGAEQSSSAARLLDLEAEQRGGRRSLLMASSSFLISWVGGMSNGGGEMVGCSSALADSGLSSSLRLDFQADIEIDNDMGYYIFHVFSVKFMNHDRLIMSCPHQFQNISHPIEPSSDYVHFRSTLWYGSRFSCQQPTRTGHTIGRVAQRAFSAARKSKTCQT